MSQTQDALRRRAPELLDVCQERPPLPGLLGDARQEEGQQPLGRPRREIRYQGTPAATHDDDFLPDADEYDRRQIYRLLSPLPDFLFGPADEDSLDRRYSNSNTTPVAQPIPHMVTNEWDPRPALPAAPAAPAAAPPTAPGPPGWPRPPAHLLAQQCLLQRGRPRLQQTALPPST